LNIEQGILNVDLRVTSTFKIPCSIFVIRLACDKINYMKKICFFFIAATMVLACSQPASTKDAAGLFNLDSAKAAITAANNLFSEAIAKGDSTAASALYSKDACIMQAGMPKICGASGIESFFASSKKMGIAGIKITSLEVVGGKEMVSEEGAYELLAADGKTIEKGKYIVNWKQEDGKWKIYRDISNSDAPPPPALAPAKK